MKLEKHGRRAFALCLEGTDYDIHADVQPHIQPLS